MFWIILTIVLYLLGAIWSYKEQTKDYPSKPWSRGFWVTIIFSIFWFLLVLYGIWDDLFGEE